MKFLTAFIPAFIATAIPLGMIYVLITNAFRADRQKVEKWLANLRKRFQAGRIPIIEVAQPVMLAVLYVIYGRSIKRRLIASFFIGLLFTSVVFGAVYWRCQHLSTTVHLAKAQLEREVDPFLYRYVTDPQLRPEYQKSQEAVQSYPYYVPPTPIYSGPPYDELRKRRVKFQTAFLAKLSLSPARTELMLLFLMEGTAVDPGFRWLSSIFLFAFNVLLDFVSVTLAIACLRSLGRRLSFRRAIGAFAFIVCGTLSCAAIGFLSYRLFFRGNIDVFSQVLALPMFLAGGLFGVGATAGLFATKDNFKSRAKWFSAGVFLILCSIFGIRATWSDLHSSTPGLATWHDFFSVPYVLAGTTCIPAMLSVVAFGLILIAKLTAEPARVMPEAYLTYVTEQLGATQAAGIIIVLSVVIAVIVGLIWPAT